MNENFLLKIVLAPNTVGFYQQVETSEYNELYDEVCQKTIEILHNRGIPSETVVKI